MRIVLKGAPEKGEVGIRVRNFFQNLSGKWSGKWKNLKNQSGKWSGKWKKPKNQSGKWSGVEKFCA